ncbi:MAG: biotin/lipoyl-containing protein [Acidobacteriota bacterium]
MELIVSGSQREANLRIERDGETFVVHLDDKLYRIDANKVSDSVRSLLFLGVEAQETSSEEEATILQPHLELSVRARGKGVYQVDDGSPGGHQITVADPLAHLARQAAEAAGAGGPQRVTAYMPGRVTRILVAEGDELKAGQGVLVLEAMKMENEIAVEADGVLARLLVEEGQAVEGGDALFEIE